MRGTQFRTTNLASNFGFSPEFVKQKMKREEEVMMMGSKMLLLAGGHFGHLLVSWHFSKANIDHHSSHSLRGLNHLGIQSICTDELYYVRAIQ